MRMVWLSGKINFQVCTGLSGLVHKKAQSIARQQGHASSLDEVQMSLLEFRMKYDLVVK